MKLALYVSTFIGTTVLFVVHFIADSDALYFKIWWLDIPMHLLGGVCVALASVCAYRLYPRVVDELSLWIGTVLIVLVIGSFWELFEVAMNYAYSTHRFDLIDMISDLINDTIGALTALYISKKLHWYAK